MAQQLPLQFEFNTQQTFSNYYPGPNLEVVTHLKSALAGGREQLIFLWGAHGVGKTHLLHASCHQAHITQHSSFIFSLNPGQLPPLRILENLEDSDWVCIDNIDCIAGHADWELAFFNFFNRHRDLDKHLVLTANTPPNFLTVDLPDLKTRLNWGLTLKLESLTDADCLAALELKAKTLGLAIKPPVGKYLLTHFARDLPSLWRLLDELDSATLAAKRKLTLPFLRQLLQADPLISDVTSKSKSQVNPE